MVMGAVELGVDSPLVSLERMFRCARRCIGPVNRKERNVKLTLANHVKKC